MTCFRNFKYLLAVTILFATNISLANMGFLVKIKEVSSSGKTISVDSGRHEGRKLGEFGFLVKKTKDGGKRVFKPIAKLRCIKLTGASSVWTSYKIYLKGDLKAGNKLMLVSESELLRGRKKLSSSRTKIVTGKKRGEETKEFLAESELGLKKQEGYSIAAQPHLKKSTVTPDYNLVDIDSWELDDFDNKKKPKAIFRSSHDKKFLEAKRVQTFEKMIVAFLNKYNNPSFDYDDFYKEQKRHGNSYTSPSSGVAVSYKRLHEERALDKIAKENKFRAEIKAKGEAWSDGYSNEELSELLNDVNKVQEKRRRRNLSNYKSNSQGYFSFGINLADNEAKGERTTTQTTRSSLEIAWEIFLLKKLEKLRKFTFEVSLRNANDAFDTGDINVASQEISMGLHINWYLHHGPEAIGRNIIYIGLNSRFGVTRLSNDFFQEEGNYQLSSFPALHFGMKYNFKNSYGVRAVLGLSNINVTRLQRSSDAGLLPNNASYFEARTGIGLSKFF